jgi:parallel beta-helix repeat protein
VTAGDSAGFLERQNLLYIALVLISASVLLYSVSGGSSPVSSNALGPACSGSITGKVELTSDIGPCSGNALIVSASNTVLNCAGYSIVGKGLDDGISMSSLAGVTITNCRVTGFAYGFYIDNSSSTYLSGNTAKDNINGFYLSGSFSNSLVGNLAENDSVGFALANGSRSNTLTGDTANGSSIGFELRGSSDFNSLNGDYGNGNSVGFRLVNSALNVLNEDTAKGNHIDGFLLASSSSGNILGSIVADNNGSYGCSDLSIGAGTGGTANTYTQDKGLDNGAGASSPPGLCLPHS